MHVVSEKFGSTRFERVTKELCTYPLISQWGGLSLHPFWMVAVQSLHLQKYLAIFKLGSGLA